MNMIVPRTRKFKRLSLLAGLSKIETVGVLELLWLYTMDQCPAGDVGQWTDEEIEEEIGWQGESGALIAALVETGWIDRCQDHRLVIHDWADHLPEFIRKRVDRNKLKLAVVRTSPDKSGQRLPLSAVVPHRNGKERIGKERNGKMCEDTHTPLLNVLSKLDGDGDEKAAWLEFEYPVILAEAESDPKSNRIVPITIRYYRKYLQGERRFRGWAEKQETKNRMAEHDAKFAAALDQFEEADL